MGFDLRISELLSPGIQSHTLNWTESSLFLSLLTDCKNEENLIQNKNAVVYGEGYWRQVPRAESLGMKCSMWLMKCIVSRSQWELAMCIMEWAWVNLSSHTSKWPAAQVKMKHISVTVTFWQKKYYCERFGDSVWRSRRIFGSQNIYRGHLCIHSLWKMHFHRTVSIVIKIFTFLMFILLLLYNWVHIINLGKQRRKIPPVKDNHC